MNKNEPIIINKAGSGYLVKPLSYIFHDDGDESDFEVFSDITTMSKWLIDHFSLSNPISKALVKEVRTHTGVVTDTKIKENKSNVRTTTKPRRTPKVKK